MSRYGSLMIRRAAALRLVASCFLLAAVTRGEPRALAAPPPAGRAQALRSSGLRALAASDYAAAARALEAAYRLKPDADGLFLLGRLAWVNGQIPAAKDVARRYLAEVEGAERATDTRQREEAARILAMPGDPEGELAVLGPPGAWVVLDGRMVGRLPLSRPLWVVAGPHHLVIETEARAIRGQAQVPAGRTVELRAQPEVGSMLLTVLPALAVLTQHTNVPAGADPLLAQAIAAAARRERLSLAPSRTGEAAGCPESLDCLDELARRGEATYVLDERVVGPGAAGAHDWTITLRLLSAATGDLAAARELGCAGCSAERAAAALQQAVSEMLALAAARPYGGIELRSTPAGAEVWSEGRRLGETPYRRATWTGGKQLELRRRGFTTWSTVVHIEEGKTSSLSVELQPEVRQERQPAPAPPSADLRPALPVSAPQLSERRRPRPRWRLIVGGVSIVLGGVLIGFGASALAADGACSPDTPDTALACRRRYTSGPYGAALVGAGGAAVVAGALLAAWPGARATPAAQLP